MGVCVCEFVYVSVCVGEFVDEWVYMSECVFV